MIVNILVGLLVAAILCGGAYMFSRDKSTVPASTSTGEDPKKTDVS